jgi:hypothetical protein
MEDKKEMLLKLLAARKPKIEIETDEIKEAPEADETDETKTDLAPEGKVISTEKEDLEVLPKGEMVEHEDEAEDMDLIAEMLGGMDKEQLGKEPKGLRERAIFEALKRKKQT